MRRAEKHMDRLIIVGRLLIDGRGGPPIERAAILVEGDRIVGVGRKEDFGQVKGVKELDFGDAALLPGLIDCHSHLGADLIQKDWLTKLSSSDAELTLSAIFNMGTDFKAGVTTLRCLGDRNFLDIACKKAVESGRMVGPRLVVAGRSIRSTHGHGFLASPFDGPEEVRRAVRENIKAGADVIKILTTATVRGPEEIQSNYSKEEIFIAVEEAHRAGIRSTAHCIGGIAVQWCLEAGMDSIEHGYFLSDREIDLLIKHDRWLILTPSPFFAEDRLQALPVEAAESIRRTREETAERMGAAIKGGVKFVVGSDAIHGRLGQEMEYLVKLGASESQAMIAATRDAARVCGLEQDIGTLEPGKIADIIAVEGNPLRDIGALKKVKAVICRGRLCYSN
jgi:imidazolonepropionase-like amidohydrolase